MSTMTQNNEPAATDTRGRMDNIERVQDRFGMRLAHVEETTNETSKDVKLLLERDAARPNPTNWKSAIATIIAFGAALVVIGQWIAFAVSSAPVTKELNERLAAMEIKQRQANRDLINRTTSRHTKQQELINCLRNEIANGHMGWVCADSQRGSIPKTRWPVTITRSVTRDSVR